MCYTYQMAAVRELAALAMTNLRRKDAPRAVLNSELHRGLDQGYRYRFGSSWQQPYLDRVSNDLRICWVPQCLHLTLRTSVPLDAPRDPSCVRRARFTNSTNRQAESAFGGLEGAHRNPDFSNSRELASKSSVGSPGPGADPRPTWFLFLAPPPATRWTAGRR